MSLAHVRIVMVRPQQPGNIGMAARAIANHGLGGLALVNPAGFDPDRARWMAPNAHHIIDNARFCSSLVEATEDQTRVIATSARPRRWSWPVYAPAEMAQLVLDEPVPTSIVFGPEDSGLATEDLERCHSILTFPTDSVASINLAQAVTVTCATLLRADPEAETERPEPSSGPSPVWLQDAVVEESVAVLETAGYLNGRSRTQVSNTLFRLIERARPTHDEAATLRGMTKQLAWWFKNREG